MATIIDGKALAEELLRDIKQKIDVVKTRFNVTPGLAVILVGDDPASRVYVANKIKKAKEIGMHIHSFVLPKTTSTRMLKIKIENLNNDQKVHGILVQLPLPELVEQFEVINTINSDKDVDGFTVKNIGLLNSWHECLEPSTPQGVLLLIKKYLGDNLSGKKAVVLGRSIIVGRPMASIFIRENCTVTLLHSKSVNIEEECRNADIIVSAIGKPKCITANLIKPGACVIDVGITRVGDKLFGDVDFDEVSKVAGFITPVPGGVGPMTVACMLSNTFKAMCTQKEIDLND